VGIAQKVAMAQKGCQAEAWRYIPMREWAHPERNRIGIGRSGMCPIFSSNRFRDVSQFVFLGA
jgi:hypothetical protein